MRIESRDGSLEEAVLGVVDQRKKAEGFESMNPERIKTRLSGKSANITYSDRSGGISMDQSESVEKFFSELEESDQEMVRGYAHTSLDEYVVVTETGETEPFMPFPPFPVFVEAPRPCVYEIHPGAEDLEVQSSYWSSNELYLDEVGI